MIAVLVLLATELFGECLWGRGPVTSAVLNLLEKEPHNGQHRTPSADPRDPHADHSPPVPAPAARTAVAAAPGAGTSLGPSRAVYEPVGTRSGVPVVQDAVPILAHRAARLLWDDHGLHFGSVMNDLRFGVDALARCEKSRPCSPSSVPNPRCACGFYAMPTDVESEYIAEADLLVELSGTVLECDRMYKAQHQRVIECRLRHCSMCAAQAELLAFDMIGWCVDLRCEEHKLLGLDGLKIRTRSEFVEACPVTVVNL